MDDFVKPRSHRLSLSGGHFIDIKYRLNHGERDDLWARYSPNIGEPMGRREVRTSKVLTYLLGWSLLDEGQPVPYSLAVSEEDRRSAIRSLDPDRFDEIHKAIEAHEDQVEQARSAEKKILSGEKTSPAISVSPSVAVGDTSGSAT